jgi:NDP-mannose synthase
VSPVRVRSSESPAVDGRQTRRAIVLAGGKGERLGPYTTVLPKPLLPIGDRAILEIVVRQLRDYGFSHLTLAVGYLDHLIRAVFDDGSDFGVTIEYHEESEPRGTAGALATIEAMSDSFLVMNGDVLTDLDYGALFEAHRSSGNAMTIASHRRVVKTEYGVLHLAESDHGAPEVVGYDEKPEVPYVVSTGVYVLEPRAVECIPPYEHFDMPELIEALIRKGERVGSYPFDGFWLDIGRHDDYERAIQEYERIQSRLLGNGATPRR